MTTMNASHSATVTGYEFVEWKRRAERLPLAEEPPHVQEDLCLAGRLRDR
ncbi:hypothetical protein [Actinomyces wuliandei]|nr:hypothetical protein [Actinomyces wuliandei]